MKNNISKIIKEELDSILKKDDINNNKIKIYHGVPFKKSADSIKKNGLQQVGDFIPVGGDGCPSISNRSYVAKELWNAIRYSFMKPGYINKQWNEFIKQEPYSYVFEFDITIDELLPDEDAIGAIVSKFLNNKNKEYKFLQKYIKNIDSKLLNDVKKGGFDAFAKIGKIIESKLTNEEKKIIVENSQTATVDKPIYPTKIYQIKKPNIQFFKTKDEYINWFKENYKQY